MQSSSPGSRKSSAVPARPASSPAGGAAPLPGPPPADGKHRNQLLAYMVAIQDARAMWQRIVQHRPGPSLHLPHEVQCMDVWAVLHGSVRQQRVWTFGKQREAALPPAAPAASDSRPCSREAAAAAPAAADGGDTSTIRPVISSSEPVSVKEGVLFSSCAAGHQHSAAAAGPYLYTWGSNCSGQCGVEAATQAPEVVHVLPAAATPAGHSAAGDSSSSTDNAAMAGRQIRKTDSLMALAQTLKLPPPLVAGLVAQKQHNLLQALEQQEQDAALFHERLQEAAAHNSSSSSCQRSADPASCNEAAAAATPGDGTGCMPQQHGQQHLFRQQHQSSARQQVPVLAVHRLHLGQAVHMVACGAKHTLAALASGLMAFGLNDKGQCGAPAAMHRVIPAPMRILGFDGCRLRCISAGAKHSAAVQENGTLITWGHGRFGRLGVGGGCGANLPPSVVGGLRGCVVTQVACGTAHTLALTSDGRVYAWGFNGQGAVGMAGDAHERLVPGLVPGLPPCTQVAAAACSMALSCEQQVYVWGRGQAQWQTSSSNSDGSAPVRREPLPWLSGVRVQQIACGVETAAAVTSSGKLLMWGQQSCMPGSLLEGATPLADAAAAACQQRSAAAQQHLGEQGEGCRDASGNATAGAAGADLAVAVQLHVLPGLGLVRVVLSCSSAGGTSNSTTSSTDAQQPEPVAAAGCPAPDGDCSDGGAEAVSPGAAGRGAFDPAREPLLGLACGESHSLLLCRASQHTPSAGEVRAAVLAVLQAFIISYLGRPLNNLNALMQQQLAADRERTEADWEGGSIAASAVSGRRRARYAGSIASFANGSSRARMAGAAGGADGLPALPFAAKAAGLHGSSGAGGGVAFAGVAEGSGSEGEGEAAPSGLRGNSGAGGSCYASSMVGGSRYAASIASRRQGGGARSVMGASAAAEKAGDSEAAAAAAPAGGPDELDIHGVLLLCRELNLVDNITEHADVMRVFELCLHRKRGRLGPAGGSEPPAAQLAAVPAEGMSQSRGQSAAQQPGVAAAGDQRLLQGGEVASPAAGASQTNKLTIVRVVRPGLPVSEAQQAAAAAGCGATNATAAAAAAILAVGRGGSPGPPGSRCGSPGPAAAATAAPRVLQVQKLDAGELLELLLTIMKERLDVTGPGGRPQPELLLRLLAGLHVSRLQARVHDKGPPWLLRQMLRPELLALVESPATSELLHGIYVHLAGSSGNPQDLSMNLSDLRKGLRQAAGFGPLRAATGGRQQGSSSAAGAKPCAARTVSRTGRTRSLPAAASASASASSRKSFHLSLHKVAAFLRSARLLPRLMDKYVAQLGQDQKQRPGSQIMPALKANASLSRVHGFKIPSAAAALGHRRRSVQDLGGSSTQQQQAAGGLSRLGTLPQSPSSMHEQADSSSSGFLLGDDDGGDSASRPALSAGKHLSVGDRALMSRGSLSSTRQQWQDSRHALPASPMGPGQQARLGPGGSFSSTVVSSAAGDDQVTGLPDLPLRRLAGPGGPGLPAAASSHRLGQTAREQQQQQQQGAAPAAAPARASHEDWLIAEGGAVDASVLDGVELVAGRSNAACILIDTDTRELGCGLAGGRHRRQSASVRLALQLPSPHTQLAQNSGRSGAAAAGSPWPSSSGGAQQPPGLAPPAAANAPGKGSSKVTYQQQQAALKQQRQAAETSAQAAAELELIRQDTWTVFVLVELLGPYLVTPPPEACARLPARLTQQQQAGVTGLAGAADGGDGTVLCSWDNGYACNGAASANSAAGGSIGSVSVDLLNHCITYPQFVEVLLCLLGLRATSLLEPDAKQLQPLSLDSEMQDHAQLVWERICKWRTRQLTPSAAAPAASRPGTAATAAVPSSSSSGGAAAGGADELDGIVPLSRVHSLFSSMRRGVLGLHRDGFLQLLAAARITGGSGVTAASAAAVFDGLSKQSKTVAAAAAAAGPSKALPDSRPVLEERQSTFMKRVTQQLLDSLEAPAAQAAMAGLPLNEEQPGQQGCPGDMQRAAAGASGTSGSLEASGSASGCCTQVTREIAAESLSSTTSRSSSSSSSRSSDTPDSCTGSGGSRSSHNGVGAAPASTGSSCTTGNTRPRTGTTALSDATPPAAAPEELAAAGASCADHDAVLTLQQFYTALRLLSKQLFPRIANGDRAWRLLLERHVTPLADKHSSGKFDQFSRSLTTPGIVALLMACERQLSELFDAAVVAQGSKQQQQQHHLPQAQGLLLLPSLLELLQEHATIPQLLQPGDVQEVLKRLMMQRRDLDGVFCGLGLTDFAHALAMVGMAVFAASRRLQQGSTQPQEQQLAAFLNHLGLRAAPVMTAAAGGAHSERGCSQSLQDCLHTSPATDPYKELWSLRFDPAAESRAHDQLSSLHHMPVLLQELVHPPSCCPAEVLPILAAAAEAQQQRSVDQALSLYGQAEEAWRGSLERQQLPAEGDDAGVLPAVGVLFLSVAASSCLLTGGRDQEAWQVLQQCEELLLLPEGLHEAAADAAVWHGAAGVALYHCGDLQAAFEHCVRAYVIRCECGLGPQHPDTAAAGHNLGVVLDCLGKSSRGLQLAEAAHQVFLQQLGSGHPRSVVAARNAQAIRHKLLKLLDSDGQPQGLMQQALAAGYSGSISEAARPAAAAVSSRQVSVASQQAKRDQGLAANARPQQGSASKGAEAGIDQRSSDPDDSSLSADDDSDHQDGAGGGRRSGGGGKASRGRRQDGGMRARLQAVSSRRQQAPEDAAGGGGPTHGNQQEQQRQQVVELRDYSSLDHLGQGVFRASLQQRELYQALRADIDAHARATSSRQPGVLEMQVLPGAGGGAASQLVQRGALRDSTVAPVEKPLTPAEARRRRLQQGGSRRAGAARAAGSCSSSLVDKLYSNA